jgi:hypothetical protein
MDKYIIIIIRSEHYLEFIEVGERLGVVPSVPFEALHRELGLQIGHIRQLLHDILCAFIASMSQS